MNRIALRVRIEPRELSRTQTNRTGTAGAVSSVEPAAAPASRAITKAAQALPPRAFATASRYAVKSRNMPLPYACAIGPKPTTVVFSPMRQAVRTAQANRRKRNGCDGEQRIEHMHRLPSIPDCAQHSRIEVRIEQRLRKGEIDVRR